MEEGRGLPPPFHAAFAGQRPALRAVELADVQDCLQLSVYEDIPRWMALSMRKRGQVPGLSESELFIRQHTYKLRGWGGGAVVSHVYTGGMDVLGGSVMAAMRAVAALAFAPPSKRRGVWVCEERPDRPKGATPGRRHYRYCCVNALTVGSVQQPDAGVYDLTDVARQAPLNRRAAARWRPVVMAQVFRRDGMLYALLTAYEEDVAPLPSEPPAAHIYLPDAYLRFDTTRTRVTDDPVPERPADAKMRTKVTVMQHAVAASRNVKHDTRVLYFDPPLVHFEQGGPRQGGRETRYHYGSDYLFPRLEGIEPPGHARHCKLQHANRLNVDLSTSVSPCSWWARDAHDMEHHITPCIMVDMGAPWKPVRGCAMTGKRWLLHTYPEELRHLQDTACWVQVVAHSRARRIQRAWRRAVSDPAYLVCQRRLLRELGDM